MNSTMNTRFSTAPFFQDIEKRKILIIGSGGAGSWLALFLSRLNTNITIVDADTFELENMAGQFVDVNSIKRFKVRAVKDNCKAFSNVNINALETYLDADNINGTLSLENFDVVVSCVDKVDVRKLLLNALHELNQDTFFIDLRLSADFFQTYAFMAHDSDKYVNYLASLEILETLDEDVCSYKQTTHIAAMSVAVATGILVNHFTNLNLECSITNIPFKTEYINSLVKLETYDQ